MAVNRLCASGAEAIAQAARTVDAGDASAIIAGGVEGMTRAPFVITAGNASPINDGATAVLIASQSTVDALALEPLGRIVTSAIAGVSPDRFSLAAMVLGCLDELPHIKPDQVNIHGGAIAIGHPLGASACVGVGQGQAVIVHVG